MSSVRIRSAQDSDFVAMQQLHASVAETPGGIAREPDEITSAYIHKVFASSRDRGLILVAEEIDKPPQGLIGSIHAYRPEPRVFHHVLSDLTIVVHPQWQRQGVGRQLFEQLLNIVRVSHPDIQRVELFARESNAGAIQFYQSLGFQIEGRAKNRIQSVGGGFEADILMGWTPPGPERG